MLGPSILDNTNALALIKKLNPTRSCVFVVDELVMDYVSSLPKPNRWIGFQTKDQPWCSVQTRASAAPKCRVQNAQSKQRRRGRRLHRYLRASERSVPSTRAAGGTVCVTPPAGVRITWAVRNPPGGLSPA